MINGGHVAREPSLSGISLHDTKSAGCEACGRRLEARKGPGRPPRYCAGRQCRDAVTQRRQDIAYWRRQLEIYEAGDPRSATNRAWAERLLAAVEARTVAEYFAAPNRWSLRFAEA